MKPFGPPNFGKTAPNPAGANPENFLKKYLKGSDKFTAEERIRILRLIENMTMGRNAVGYLTESMHGAGSPQAQRIQIQRLMQIEYKKRLARVLAGLDVDEERKDGLANELGQYFERVFKVEPN